MATTVRRTPEYDAEINRLLSDNNTDRYFIEYGGFMSNHISHGIFALQQLAASLDRVNDFVLDYGDHMEPASAHRKREDEENRREPRTADQLLGSRRSYYQLRDHYSWLLSQRYDGQLDALVAGQFPKLSRGLLGSALHGLIHLGYGLQSGLAWFVCEGLAYLHYSYLPLALSGDGSTELTEFGRGDVEILDVLDQLRNDAELIEYMNETSAKEPWASMKRGNFQPKAALLFTNKADVLIGYANKVRLPAGVDPDGIGPDGQAAILQWLLDCAIIIHAIAEKTNDFFLVHGVTSAWAFQKIVSRLTDPQQTLDAVRTYLCALFAVYLVQGSPRLQRALLADGDHTTHQWHEIINRSLEAKARGDEHVYKLVHICHGLSEESNTDSKMDAIYRLCAYQCVNNPLQF